MSPRSDRHPSEVTHGSVARSPLVAAAVVLAFSGLVFAGCEHDNLEQQPGPVEAVELSPVELCEAACDCVAATAPSRSFELAECHQGCSARTNVEARAFASCVEQASCDELSCLDTIIIEAPRTSDILRCELECRQLERHGCIIGADVGTCEQSCSQHQPVVVDHFIACTESGMCEDESCFRIFDATGGLSAKRHCQQACDDLATDGCLRSDDMVECRAACDSAPVNAIDDFRVCATNVCGEGDCYHGLLSDLP